MGDNLLSRNELEKILDEISEFHIDLAVDPTLPTLGNRYLQETLSKCRGFLNRVTHYLIQTRRYEKYLRNGVKRRELDLDFKIKGLLADEEVVRRQPAAQDRLAVATSMLRTEYEELSKFRVDLQDTEETVKLIKVKLDELRQTNTDVKLQRQMVKDDRQDQFQGGSGYAPPQTKQDRTIPGGMQPPVSVPIAPMDLLYPDAKPEDLPEPVNGAHAKLIEDFFSNPILTTPPPVPAPEEPSAPMMQIVDYSDILS